MKTAQSIALTYYEKLQPVRWDMRSESRLLCLLSK